MDKFKELMRVADEVQQITKEAGTRIDRKFEKLMFLYSMADGVLGWNELIRLPVGSEVVLPSSNGSRVVGIKAPYTGEEMSFMVSFDDYGVLLQHTHPDCEEYVKVLGGNFRVMIGECNTPDEICKRFELKEGQEYYIPAGIKHQFTNIKGEGMLEVKFRKV